jgi:hypothetical protein
MLDFESLGFRYEPFPIGVMSRPFSPADYAELAASFPPRELFAREEETGSRLIFKRRHGRGYRSFVASRPEWRELRRWVESEAFIRQTLEALATHHIELSRGVAVPTLGARLRRRLSGRALDDVRAAARHLRVEMVFCRMPVDGGCLLPHTDDPAKLVNLAFSMIGAEGWDAGVGGDTELNRPKDVRLIYNLCNRRLGFDDVEAIDSVPFLPNQCLTVVKTHDSWHCIRPMRGRGSPAMRKSVNVNILRR